MRYTLYLLVVIPAIWPLPVIADGTLVAWGPSTLEGMSEQRWEAAKTRSVEELLALNRELGSWPEAVEVLLGAQEHKHDVRLLRGLVGQMVDKTEVELKHTSRLVIWERTASGDIFFEGKGLQVDDDLFTVAGRANWVLRTITDRRFGVIRPRPSPEDLARIQARWTKYLDGEPIEESPERYPAEKRGLHEIRSPAAICALIKSLEPSERKTEYTKQLLRDLYGLEELPEDPLSPARFCDPDTYARWFLAVNTGISQSHPHEWWTAWWLESSGRLVWNKEKAQFEVGTVGMSDEREHSELSDIPEKTDAAPSAKDTPIEARFVANVKWIEMIGKRETSAVLIGVDVRWLVGIEIRSIAAAARGFDREGEAVLAVHSPVRLFARPRDEVPGKAYTFKISGRVRDGRIVYHFAHATEHAIPE